jgi:hypothetical protein
VSAGTTEFGLIAHGSCNLKDGIKITTKGARGRLGRFRYSFCSLHGRSCASNSCGCSHRIKDRPPCVEATVFNSFGHGIRCIGHFDVIATDAFDELCRRVRHLSACLSINARVTSVGTRMFRGICAGLADGIFDWDCPSAGRGKPRAALDMGDPVGAIKHVRETMAGDGTCMLVEPFAHDRLEDNLNPVGRVYYAASTMICTPASLDQEVGLGLGAQAGEARLRDVARQGGLTRFRRAAETPFNLILEARP